MSNDSQPSDDSREPGARVWEGPAPAEASLAGTSRPGPSTAATDVVALLGLGDAVLRALGDAAMRYRIERSEAEGEHLAAVSRALNELLALIEMQGARILSLEARLDELAPMH